MSQKDNNLATASRWLPTPLLALADGLLLASGFQQQREAIEQVATTPVGPIFRGLMEGI